jgi:uncharacterized protein YdeI (YjbR/CyaY-like superfamily)
MATLDPRIDAYIAQSAAFAQPILTHLRALVHAACPEVEETIKWGMPHFMYKGILGNMAAFKAHCAFGLWHGDALLPKADTAAMGHLGRITALADLPSNKQLTAWIKESMRLADAGVKAPRAKAPPRPLTVPAYFDVALSATPAARAVFDAGSTSFRREYVDWLEEAKTEATRLRRMAQAIEWLAQGKARNWKYERC